MSPIKVGKIYQLRETRSDIDCVRICDKNEIGLIVSFKKNFDPTYSESCLIVFLCSTGIYNLDVYYQFQKIVFVEI